MSKFTEYLKRKIWILKATVASQVSSWIDFALSYACFAWIGLSSGWSAAMGAIAGGIINCTINYKWTFKTTDSAPVCVFTKFVIVWLGSLFLNTFGTELFTYLFVHSSVLDYYHVSVNLRFTAARLLVALTVSLVWNLRLQKIFVYRHVKADEYIMQLYQRLIAKAQNNKP